MNIVELTHVEKAYGKDQGRVVALHNLSLQVQAGEFACVWGASGSGKSTLLNLIGLLDRADLGAVRVDGTDCATLGESEAAQFRNATIGFVFQGFNLVPVLSALENVMLPLQIAAVPAAEGKARALRALADVGLEQQARKLPDEMSGGQRQRVAIARALVNDPKLVLADEPTANLDSVTAESVIALMRKLNNEKGVTFVFSTHDARLLGYAGRRLELSDGRIVTDTRHANERAA
ncbi:ATP-binding cassette domain-containing protein [Massilia dura]|uniref:ATP-binding cassette domain-containing protein n=1 Tax=Pseudoduganella dura TaxID=321982 RepID=A0A6I3XIM5_9BURK|nr:ABC transporter ATP-binding protein [Pseudoduganella dura]MUI13042.1 ATP-binding cassette domain-containing protein [Pseudoduganella dura]GGX87673.1 macrolide ABC transporter ATP-binding protein [Pseudoduganella dura]